MKNSAARRYAKALIEIGAEEKAVEKYGSELRSAAAHFGHEPNLYKALTNPMYKLESRRELIASVSKSLGLSQYVAKFLTILVETRKIGLLDEISDAYSRLEDELVGRIKAVVESPEELGASILDEIKQKLSSSTGKDVVLTHRKNADLLGGLVIRIDNTILDGSLKTQLELMKEKILEGV